jgi:glycolate oxidase iron-sulfur subunit
MDLHLDPDELSTCVQCGLCLPHCPTFRVSGDESQSPRGRIALMRAVQDDGAPVTAEVLRSFETCVQCRGCETACPSGVPYGHLIEGVRSSLADAGLTTPWWQRAAFVPLTHPRLLRAGSRAIAVMQRTGLVPERLGLPTLPLRSAPLRSTPPDPASGGPAPQGSALRRSIGLRDRGAVWDRTRVPLGDDEVYLFTGCVMDAWQRDIHLDAQHVLEAAGFVVRHSGDEVPCCGALQGHAGLVDQTRALAHRAMRALPGDAPILVDSAGCGAALKDYGHLLGTAEAKAFSARVYDICEWLADHLDRLPTVAVLDLRVAVQDPCHLRHVQRVHQATRTVLAPFVREVVELDDEGLCCGAGGAYSVLEPHIAGLIRDRKVAAIERAAADVVASANPGCSMHLAGAGVHTQHPMSIVARALNVRGNPDAAARREGRSR